MNVGEQSPTFQRLSEFALLVDWLVRHRSPVPILAVHNSLLADLARCDFHVDGEKKGVDARFVRDHRENLFKSREGLRCKVDENSGK